MKPISGRGIYVTYDQGLINEQMWSILLCSKLETMMNSREREKFLIRSRGGQEGP
jgi:hypothetical protein